MDPKVFVTAKFEVEIHEFSWKHFLITFLNRINQWFTT